MSRQRTITKEQAEAAFRILVAEAGHRDNPDALYDFVYQVALAPNPTDEFRFCGALGFGGKFRNNGNRTTPYVDCYPEDMNDTRQSMIERTNAHLKALFSVELKPMPKTV